MSDIDRLAADLVAAAARVVSRGRGAAAPVVDAAAAKAKRDALSAWSKYGRGEAGSAGTIRGRMSQDKSKVQGYVMADGQGAFQSEHGTHSRAPTPVMFHAAESVVDDMADALADMAEGLL